VPTVVLVDYIDQYRDRFGVEPICKVLAAAETKIAPSSYYAAKSRPPSARAVKDAELVPKIRRLHKDNLQVYGARKVHAELNRGGIDVARCTVERLMRAEGLRGITRDKTRKTTQTQGAETPRPADLVKRRFVAEAPNQLWVADLTSSTPLPGGSTPRSSSTCSPAWSWAGRSRPGCAPTWPWTPSTWDCGPGNGPATTSPG
jgi:putative transposase